MLARPEIVRTLPTMSAATRPVSILKMGFAEPELLAKYGDYVDMVRRKLPATLQATAQVIDPSAGGALPEPQSVESLIITGSSSMVTDPTPTDLIAFNWLERVLAAGCPVLGLCYGHQMLGHILGGEVGPLPGGPEIGVADITLDAADDPLFSACGAQQRVAVIHWQTILRLPDGARVLGKGIRDPHQAVRFAKNVWGVQFHPEFSRAVMIDYVEACSDEIDELGLDPKTAAAEMAQWTEDQTQVIARFAQL
jgi:GMP synthase (glutamine-hydrolysing)